MTAAPKVENLPDGFVDNEPTEEVVNDSLGTVDPADSDGLDLNKEEEIERDQRIKEKS
jgi:hypothetical protein